VCDLTTGKLDVEVVGPGFDASDTLRGDITPHERFEVSIEIMGNRAQQPHIRRVDLIAPAAYRTSAQRRLAKIGARLRNPAFPDEVLRAADASPLELAKEATRWLLDSRQVRLLDHLNEYEPIPQAFLNAFLNQLARLVRSAEGLSLPWKTISVAGSFLEPSRLVMWDFFPPGSHDTSVLAAMTALPSPSLSVEADRALD